MKNSNLFAKPVILLLSLALTFLMSCLLEVPMKEMVNAKTAIDSARGVDAEKYSPDELNRAEQLLMNSHDLLAGKKESEAKKAADDSLAAAIEAEKKALPQYADAHMKVAADEYAEADKVYAEKFSPENFAKAGELNNSAKAAYDGGEYRKAAALADEAQIAASAARDESVKNSSMIEGQITALDRKIAELKKDKFSKDAESNLRNASVSTANARSELANKNFKPSLDEIKKAETEIDAAALIIKKKGMSASIEKLRGDVSTIRKTAVSPDVKNDLDRALLALNSAESSMEQNYLDDAAMKIKEAENLISGADAKQKEGTALAALARAEKLLGEANEKDAEKKHADRLGKAGALITNGKASVKNRQYNEGISNAEEAESIIAAVLNSIEAEINEAKLKASVAEGKEEPAKEEEKPAVTEETAKAEEKAKEEPQKPEGKYYTVQWRKKNTDCLWRISQKVYKDAAYWPAIFIANRDQIKDPDLIFPGQKFIIPPKPEKRPSYKKLMEEEKKAKEKAQEKEKSETK